MKSKRGYKKQKILYSTGKWLKWYFIKKTCRKNKVLTQHQSNLDLDTICQTTIK